MLIQVLFHHVSVLSGSPHHQPAVSVCFTTLIQDTITMYLDQSLDGVLTQDAVGCAPIHIICSFKMNFCNTSINSSNISLNYICPPHEEHRMQTQNMKYIHKIFIAAQCFHFRV